MADFIRPTLALQGGDGWQGHGMQKCTCREKRRGKKSKHATTICMHLSPRPSSLYAEPSCRPLKENRNPS